MWAKWCETVRTSRKLAGLQTPDALRPAKRQDGNYAQFGQVDTPQPVSMSANRADMAEKNGLSLASDQYGAE
jgi:hypothetical protein